MEEQIELHVSLRYAFSLPGDLTRIGDETRMAEALATALGKPRQRARTAIYRTHYLWVTGALDEALESGALACLLAEKANNPTLTALATLLLGVVHYSRGDYNRAADLLSTPVPSAGDLAREGHTPPTAQAVLYGAILVRCLAFLGRFDEAAARGREVLRLAETTDRSLNLVHACSALGSVHLLKGDLEDAVVVLERGLQLCRAESFRIPFPALASTLGTVYVGSGRVVEGLALLQEAAGPNTTLEHHFVPAGLTNLGWGYLLAGRPDEATEVAARALNLARERHDRGVEGYALRLLGEITMASDPVDVTAARGWFQKALEIAQELEMRPLVAHCYFGLGRLHGRVSDSRIAEEHMASARSIFLDWTCGSTPSKRPGSTIGPSRSGADQGDVDPPVHLTCRPAAGSGVDAPLDRRFDRAVSRGLGKGKPVSRAEHRALENSTLAEAGTRLGKHPVDAMLDLAVADGLETEFYSPSINTELDYLKEIITSDLTLLGVSDGGAHTKFTAGRYPTETLARLVREHQLMSLKEAHWRLSALPAWCAGFRNRSTLHEGAPADVVVYDHERLAVLPTEVARDFPGGEWRRVQRARGYRAVVVNGEITFEDDKHTGRTPGLLPRHGGG